MNDKEHKFKLEGFYNLILVLFLITNFDVILIRIIHKIRNTFFLPETI